MYVIRQAVVKIFNEKNGKKNISRLLQKLNPLEITPERDDDEPPPDKNDVDIEESKSLIDHDSTEGDLGGSDAEGRTKIPRAAAIDIGDMKRRLRQQDEEGDEFDDLGSELREVNRIDQLLIDQGGWMLWNN